MPERTSTSGDRSAGDTGQNGSAGISQDRTSPSFLASRDRPRTVSSLQDRPHTESSTGTSVVSIETSGCSQDHFSWIALQIAIHMHC